jgi:dCMP deaminase
MRLSVDDYFINLALAVSLRGTCVRRQVGCVLVDERDRVLSTGYNGVTSGQPHCVDSPCPGANFASGTGLDECEALHAEQNAVVYCPNVSWIKTCYVTVSPCVSCVKLLLGTSCRRIVFAELYPQAKAVELWGTREWIHRDTRFYQVVIGRPSFPTITASMGLKW